VATKQAAIIYDFAWI